jgi:hypothetical protein
MHYNHYTDTLHAKLPRLIHTPDGRPIPNPAATEHGRAALIAAGWVLDLVLHEPIPPGMKRIRGSHRVEYDSKSAPVIRYDYERITDAKARREQERRENSTTEDRLAAIEARLDALEAAEPDSRALRRAGESVHEQHHATRRHEHGDGLRGK